MQITCAFSEYKEEVRGSRTVASVASEGQTANSRWRKGPVVWLLVVRRPPSSCSLKRSLRRPGEAPEDGVESTRRGSGNTTTSHGLTRCPTEVLSRPGVVGAATVGSTRFVRSILGRPRVEQLPRDHLEVAEVHVNVGEGNLWPLDGRASSIGCGASERKERGQRVALSGLFKRKKARSADFYRELQFLQQSRAR